MTKQKKGEGSKAGEFNASQVWSDILRGLNFKIQREQEKQLLPSKKQQTSSQTS